MDKVGIWKEFVSQMREVKLSQSQVNTCHTENTDLSHSNCDNCTAEINTTKSDIQAYTDV